MRMTNSLKALEKTMEKEVLTFFTLLGAGEAPEDWQATGQPLPEPESDRKAETTAPHHRPTEASDRSSH